MVGGLFADPASLVLLVVLEHGAGGLAHLFSSAAVWTSSLLRFSTCSRRALLALHCPRGVLLRRALRLRSLASRAWLVVLAELEPFFDLGRGHVVPAFWTTAVLRASATSRRAHGTLVFARERVLLEAADRDMLSR